MKNNSLHCRLEKSGLDFTTPTSISQSSAIPMGGLSSIAPTLTRTNQLTQQAAITALHHGPNSAPSNEPLSLVEREIHTEEEPPSADNNLDDALENFDTEFCGEEPVETLDGPNGDPTLSNLEHRQQSAAASAAHIFTETSLQLVPARENSPETMIVVAEHPIFFQIGGSTVRVRVRVPGRSSLVSLFVFYSLRAVCVCLRIKYKLINSLRKAFMTRCYNFKKSFLPLHSSYYCLWMIKPLPRDGNL